MMGGDKNEKSAGMHPDRTRKHKERPIEMEEFERPNILPELR